MFGETHMFVVMIWSHPIETTIFKWTFRVASGTSDMNGRCLGDASIVKTKGRIDHPLHSVERQQATWMSRWKLGSMGYFTYLYSLSQWLNFKLFGITYFVGKIKFKLLSQGPLAE